MGQLPWSKLTHSLQDKSINEGGIVFLAYDFMIFIYPL